MKGEILGIGKQAMYTLFTHFHFHENAIDNFRNR